MPACSLNAQEDAHDNGHNQERDGETGWVPPFRCTADQEWTRGARCNLREQVTAPHENDPGRDRA